MLEINKLVNKKDKTVYDVFFQKRDEFSPLVFFGAGAGVYDMIRIFKDNNCKMPAAICDNNSNKWGEQISGIPIVSLDEIKSKYNDFYVLVTAPANAHLIIPDLEKRVDKDKILFFTGYEQAEIIEFNNFLSDNVSEFSKLYHRLADDRSKITLEAVLKARASGDYSFYKSVFNDNQYFTEEIIKLENDVFLDIGAYDGDTIEKFIDASDEFYKKIIGVEPHPELFDQLRDISSKYRDVETYNIAASDINGEIKLVFDDNDLSSGRIEEGVDGKVICNKIDDIISEKVTFIKMDIEGAEVKALKGAEQTIRNYKPKLAICLYHKYTDFLDIPNLILNFNPDYKLFIRHHTYYMGETVLYAI